MTYTLSSPVKLTLAKVGLGRLQYIPIYVHTVDMFIQTQPHEILELIRQVEFVTMEMKEFYCIQVKGYSAVLSDRKLVQCYNVIAMVYVIMVTMVQLVSCARLNQSGAHVTRKALKCCTVICVIIVCYVSLVCNPTSSQRGTMTVKRLDFTLSPFQATITLVLCNRD